MVYFPIRKCYHVAKVCLLLILVVSLLALFEHYRGGKRTTEAQFSDPIEAEYEREILEDEARIIPGLGEGGVAAHLLGEDKRLGEESEKKLAINVHLSERIAYNRTLKDYRNPACQRVVYDAELPSASVVIIFHNEPYSVVVRTIWSVVNSARRDQPWYKQANFVDRETGNTMNLGYPGQDPNSPLVYLKEIILVDDNSTLPELKGKLSHYVRTRLPPDLIRIIRLPDRMGLTRARLAGARYAVGDVLVFLDAHCEGQTDWLRPLLDRIKHEPHAVVVPIIDVIGSSDFYYSVQDPTVFQVGGFTFMGHFTWIEVPEREKKRRGSDISPTWSPTMAGGLFAMSRTYYWELGAYDEQMAGWGGENLEISFRIWQCGGTLETIPCSRVGHVFRSFHPYGLPAHTDTHGINTARMADVWMDEYAELFYLHRPDLRKNPKIGDVTHRKVLREKLHCKSFQWYLDNVYPEKFVPVRHVYGYGRVANPESNLCLDTLQRESGAALGVYGCHSRLHATQYFALSLHGQLRTEEDCAELQFVRDEDAAEVGRRVLMVNCHGKQRGQKWKYLPSGQLQHEESRLCLSAGREPGDDVRAAACGPGDDQAWRIDYTLHNHFHAAGDAQPSEQELRLQKLRGQRRISRSLLSARDDGDGDGDGDDGDGDVRRHHHRGRRPSRERRRRNKFVLQLVRTLMNGSEQHLEAELGCRHRRLYPNDTFVRDLVTILNERNVKVINNGRVFERNKVTELSRADGHHHHPARPPHTHAEWPPNKHQRGRSEQTTTAANLQPPLPPATGDTSRIIIEDFVERPGKKHKRKRQRSPPSPPPGPTSPRPTPADDTRDVLMALLNKQQEDTRGNNGYPSEVEDVPMVSEPRERDGDRDRAASERDGDSERDDADEHWPIGESRFRRNNSLIQPLRRDSHPHPHPHQHQHQHQHAREHTRPHIDDSRENDVRQNYLQSEDTNTKTRTLPVGEHVDQLVGEQTVPPPVRVVMRSNLTFHLDDEFFTSRRRPADDVNDIIGELAIPTNISHTWVKPRASTADLTDTRQFMNDVKTDDSREVISTGRGVMQNSVDDGSSASDDYSDQ
ncbi:uncharacterized protein LOC131852186 [Achroia grisella]|uniref:uncharacterized protein LOC131852186 n=1 Tax=Achroia grisella TaxID=688607 RepID=UPI0027D34C3A|nr:uncharacterized protein LOC131852186 [Achroia grisella]